MNNADLTFIFLAIAFAAMMMGRFLVRRFTLHFRRIPAYDALPLLTADAIESDHRLHFGLGSSSLGTSSTLSALTGIELVYRMSERLAINEKVPTLTVSSPTTMLLAQDTLRRAYEYRKKWDTWRTALAVWYPAGKQSFAYAAGAASLSADRRTTSHILFGHYGAELALLGESALRHDQHMIAHSDRLEGQAIAYAQADRVLLGEELYVGPAYMDGNALQRGGIFALETLRWLVIFGIIIEAILAAI